MSGMAAGIFRVMGWRHYAADRVLVQSGRTTRFRWPVTGGVAMRFPAFTLLGLIGAGLLAGCVADPDEKAPECPNAFLRPDASTVTRYDGRGTDLTNLVLSGRLQDVQGTCKGVIGGKQEKAKAHVDMILTRGPAAQGREVDVPYVVAVTRGGQVLEKQLKTQHVVFPPNVDTVQVTGDDVTFLFPTPHFMSGKNYSIYFLFELTQAELEANEKADRH
jgi:hypothetical protein